MLCYRDRTFCDFYKDCKDGQECIRAATPELYKKAKDFGAPVCRFVDKPSCFLQNKAERVEE